MIRRHHRFSRHEFEQTPGDSERQGSLVCCSPWGCIELDMTERLNNNIIKILYLLEISSKLPVSTTNFVYILHVCMLSRFSCVRLFATLRTVSH